eukprot:scaffold125934_cov31-Tisochrysis_lutea.AAC.3
MATVLGSLGVSITARKGFSCPSSAYARILHGRRSAPARSSMSASSGRPPVLISTWTRCTIGER